MGAGKCGFAADLRNNGSSFRHEGYACFRGVGSKAYEAIHTSGADVYARSNSGGSGIFSGEGQEPSNVASRCYYLFGCGGRYISRGGTHHRQRYVEGEILWKSEGFAFDGAESKAAVVAEKIEDFIKLLVDKTCIIRDYSDGDNRAGLYVIVVHFGYRDVEAVFESFDETFDDFPLVLERNDSVQIKLSCHYTYYHRVIPDHLSDFGLIVTQQPAIASNCPVSIIGQRIHGKLQGLDFGQSNNNQE